MLIMSPIISGKDFKLKISSYIKEKYTLNDSKLFEEIPKTWEKYGDLILFRDCFFLSNIWKEGNDVWEFICRLLNGKRIALKGKINDDYRTPKVKIIYGDISPVKFTDNGIIYCWDIEKVMFCRGNASERHRVARLDCKDEVIVDLFAGIGYFTLPYLVHAKAKIVYACDWNPTAVFYLRQNLELNNVSNRCKIYEGDNREAPLSNLGNRVNVGIIPDSEGFWLTACKALLSSGGILYIHQNVTTDLKEKKKLCCQCPDIEEEIDPCSKISPYVITDYSSSFSNESPCIVWKKLERFYFSLHVAHTVLGHLTHIYRKSWSVSVREYFNIKSYAPHIDHLVFGVYAQPL